MDELSFDGRVAIVTGAGRGLGRAYARLLAARGARVVVNDLGSSMAGNGADDGPATAVAAEIVADGGAAVADAHDVADPLGAAALVDATVEHFGRVDVLVNNAGIMRWADMPDVDAAALEQHLAVHTVGSFNTTRAAWPRLVEQGYGRVVMTTSTGVFGLRNNLPYASAKGAVIGMTRSLAVAGRDRGITVNAIAPAAVTRMAGMSDAEAEAADDGGAGPMSPALVAPMVAFLAHERCPVTGEIYSAGGNRFARLFIASTEGYVHAGPAPTVEDVADHWATINDETGYTVPVDLNAWSAGFAAHLSPRRSGGGR